MASSNANGRSPAEIGFALAVVAAELAVLAWRAGLAGPGGHGRPMAIGEPANLVLVDPDASWTVDRDASRSLSRNNPWHGRTLPAPVVATVLRGECTAYRGRVRGQFDLEELS